MCYVQGDPSLASQYVYSFYWSTLTLTKIGETPQPMPDNNYELAFVTGDFLIGVLIFAAILGNISMVISNMTVEKTTFSNRMDAIKGTIDILEDGIYPLTRTVPGYMVFRQIGGTLESRVIKWFDYLWANKAALDEETIFNMLPKKLKLEMAMQVSAFIY